MPKSKSRVKKNGKRPERKVKIVLPANFMPDHEREFLYNLFERVNLFAEVTLPMGRCTYKHATAIRDVINACVWSLTYLSGNGLLADDWLDEQYPYVKELQNKFQTFYARGNAKGGMKDRSVRYVATGDELRAIRDGLIVANDGVCLEMIKTRPIIFKRLFLGMKEFLLKDDKSEFEGDDLANAIKRI